MAYALLADILAQAAEADLIALTDDTVSGVVDTAVVDAAILNAGAVIDAHCGARYPVPFMPVPDVIRLAAVDLSVFNLYSRRTHIETPKVILERQRQTLVWLRRVQDGTAEVLPGAEPTSHGASFQTSPRLFSRTSMRWP